MTRSRPLRIGIGAQILGKGKGGVETCVASLIGALQELETPHQFILYVSQGHPLDPAALPNNFDLRELPSANPWVERPLLIPLAFRRDRLDVIFLQRALPFWGCRPAVVHQHDAMYVTHADLFAPLKRHILISMFKRSIRRAAAVVTPSSAAREDIMRCYGAPAEKTFVVPNAVDLSNFRPDDGSSATAKILARFSVSRPYAVYLGAVERNKNLAVLLDAFALFARDLPEYQLAIVGKWRQETKAGYYPELQGQIARLGLADKVVFTGYVSNAERRALLAGASMLAFPSVAEGFGLPPLEAMASGVPAIAARIPASEEVVGDAGMLVAPGDPADLAAAMTRVARNPSHRDELIRRGFERVKEFSWKRSAERLLEILERAAG